MKRTIKQIAEVLGETKHRVEYAVRSRGVRSERVGARGIVYIDEDGFAIIAEYCRGARGTGSRARHSTDAASDAELPQCFCALNADEKIEYLKGQSIKAYKRECTNKRLSDEDRQRQYFLNKVTEIKQ